ncbi:MAG: penicillin acylase family protein [Acidobacteriota bacterium]
MKTRRHLPYILIVFSTLFVQLTAYSQNSSTVSTVGLKDQVTVKRDARGIPYISTTNEADLYFAQGYITASDRLWQMDLMRRLARGQTAELFGARTIEEDKRWRRYGFSKVAEDSMQYLSPDLRAALENYARGVNAYIATLDDKTIPVEFNILQYRPTEWKPTDTVVIGKILADALSATWQQDLLKASLQNIPKEKLADLSNPVTPYDVVLFGKDTVSAQTTRVSKPVAVDPNEVLAANDGADVRKRSLEMVGLYAEDLAASNNWVISGSRTADGKPLLANDPHLAATAPGIWYLVNLTSPNVHAAGVVFPGVPGVILGHNDSIAWGATNVGPDVQDLYLETFDASGKYRTPDGLKDPVVRKEEIKVRKNLLKPDTEIQSLDVTETRNGPIVFEEGGKRYAMRWTAFDPKNGEFEAFFKLNRAKNWDDFRAALKTYGGSMQNFVFADVKGNIGWYPSGRIPLRRTGDGSLPYDGSTSDGDWVGYVPFEELPNVYNPKDGLIVTANQRAVGTGYKYFNVYARDIAMPWRAHRIHELLEKNTKVTMDDVRDTQLDVFNLPLSDLSKQIVKLNAASSETLNVIKNWDGRMTTDSEAALLVNEIRNCSANAIADDNRPVPAYLIRERILYWAVDQQSARWLPKAYSSYADLLKACDASSRTSLADPKRFGPDESKWLWGAVTKARFPHPLAAAPLIGGQFATPNVPINGSGQTPNVASNVSMRLIASPGNWDLTRHVIPLGESGDPKSPHFKDQFDLWRTGTPAVFPFNQTAVDKVVVSNTTLTPR